MNRILTVLVSFGLFCTTDQVFGSNDMSYAEADMLTPQEAATLAYLWEEQKHLRDLYITGAGCSDNPEVASAAIVEQDHMNVLRGWLNHYGLEVPVPDEELGVFTESFYNTMPGWTGYNYACINPDRTIFITAIIYEEMAIWNLLQAIDQTNNPWLLDAYNHILADSCEHLRLFVSLLPDWEGIRDLFPGFLTQGEFDAVLAGTLLPGVSFTINAGLNDAWYYPETSGQGFFISVYPELNVVSLGWFTYDTELPPEGAMANLGDPGHRWLTAVGPIEGDHVLMNIEMTSGGIFDTATEIVRTDPPGSDGTIKLTFHSCNSGTVEYDIPSINRQGIVPIQRVAGDNVALCEALQD
jgi:hypothetical protein